jgi:ABC-type nitrate/sulfonate/bicarbonate transport system ATPase subunit
VAALMAAIDISITHKAFPKATAATIANFQLNLASGEFVCLVAVKRRCSIWWQG